MTTEAEQRASLRAMKRLATMLLVVMTGLFILSRYTEHAFPAMVWIRVFSEAAMIGAMADWFAVTALFRHPLGLPIPHTAIIPKNKERIAKTIGTFVQENFLSEEALSEKLSKISFTSIFCEWFASKENIEKFSLNVARGMPAFLNTLTQADIQRLVSYNFKALSASGFHMTSALGSLLSLLVTADREQRLLNQGLVWVEELLDKHAAFVSSEIKRELPWYVPEFVHDRVYQAVLERIRQILNEVNENPDHPLRERFLEAAQYFADQLKTSPYYRERGQEMWQKISSNPVVLDYVLQLWTDFKDAVAKDVHAENSRTAEFIREVLLSLSAGIQRDPELMQHIDDFIRESLRHFVRKNSAEIVAFISDTVKRWDSRTTVEKLELQIGKDLQFIRLNGTLVGGLVGLIIYALSLLIQGSPTIP